MGDGDEDDDPGSAWSDGRLAAALLAARGVRECKLQGCGLATLPGAREVWEHLAPTTHTLALSGNALDDLPASVGALRGLKRLRLEGNLLRALPEAVVRLGALEELWLGCNQLSGLPDGFGALTRLRDLWLVSNEISYLPASFGELTSLRRLELSANALHDLPRSFAKLASLEELWLRSNALSAFPQQLCALEKLRVLDVAANAITTLPRAVAHMPALTTLELEGNPLVFPPAGLVSQGSAAVLDFVRGYRQSDLRSTESERSAREIVSSRDRLASSLSINGGGAPPQPGEEVDEPAAPAAADAAADAADAPWRPPMRALPRRPPPPAQRSASRRGRTGATLTEILKPYLQSARAADAHRRARVNARAQWREEAEEGIAALRRPLLLNPMAGVGQDGRLAARRLSGGRPSRPAPRRRTG